MDLKFAFAVNQDKTFNSKFFGEADTFLIYQVEEDKLKLIEELENEFKLELTDNEPSLISLRTENIIEKLISNDVKVIVSKEFSESLRYVNEYFIPVKVVSENLEGAIEAIENYLHWIIDELNNFSSGYKLFTIRSGILKSVIH